MEKQRERSSVLPRNANAAELGIQPAGWIGDRRRKPIGAAAPKSMPPLQSCGPVSVDCRALRNAARSVDTS